MRGKRNKMGGQLLEKNQLFPLKRKILTWLNLVDFRKAAISPSSLINHWIDQQWKKARFFYSFGLGNSVELSSYLPSDIAFQQATFLLLLLPNSVERRTISRLSLPYSTGRRNGGRPTAERILAQTGKAHRQRIPKFFFRSAQEIPRAEATVGRLLPKREKKKDFGGCC